MITCFSKLSIFASGSHTCTRASHLCLWRISTPAQMLVFAPFADNSLHGLSYLWHIEPDVSLFAQNETEMWASLITEHVLPVILCSRDEVLPRQPQNSNVVIMIRVAWRFLTQCCMWTRRSHAIQKCFLLLAVTLCDYPGLWIFLLYCALKMLKYWSSLQFCIEKIFWGGA